jgi:cytochrome c oxidase subunit 2
MSLMSRFARRSGVAIAGVATALLLASCGNANDQPLTTLDPVEGTQADDLRNLIDPVYAIAAVIFVLIVGGTLLFVIKFRAKGDDDRPKQIEGNTRAEITWTIIPALIMLGVAVFTVPAIIQLDRDPKGDELTTQVLAQRIERGDSIDDTKLTVEVIGHQWWWEFRYNGLGGDGITTGPLIVANELVIPANVETQLNLRSADVIHNFWIPRIAGKVYAIPGRENMLKLESPETGTYLGQCAEFCGSSHANMRMRVVVLEPLAFQDWAKRQIGVPSRPVADPNNPAKKGATLFVSRGCAGCHAVNGFAQGNVGPNLTHLYDRSVFAGAIFQLNDENMRKWLRNPQKEKPGSLMVLPQQLSEDDITNLTAYLKTLKSCDTPTSSLNGNQACPNPSTPDGTVAAQPN